MGLDLYWPIRAFLSQILSWAHEGSNGSLLLLFWICISLSLQYSNNLVWDYAPGLGLMTGWIWIQPFPVGCFLSINPCWWVATHRLGQIGTSRLNICIKENTFNYNYFSIRTKLLLHIRAWTPLHLQGVRSEQLIISIHQDSCPGRHRLAMWGYYIYMAIWDSMLAFLHFINVSDLCRIF